MQYRRLAFGDCEEGAVEKALSILGADRTVEKKLIEWRNHAQRFMSTVNLDITNQQLAVALVLCQNAPFPGQKGCKKY